MPVAGISDPRAIAFADINDDGDLDFAIAAKRSSNWLVRNDFNSGNWLKVKLVSPLGQAGAFGAKTFVYPAGSIGVTQIGHRESKSNYGYLGQDDPLLHFGLGDARQAGRVPWIDATPHLRSRPDTTELYFVLDGHWSPLGHRAIAELLADQLLELGLIDPGRNG